MTAYRAEIFTCRGCQEREAALDEGYKEDKAHHAQSHGKKTRLVPNLPSK